ncbi:hypothetical protein C6Y45_16975 [Alkalicoccus saliphilus]|uniref:Uncharacterized protein n=1 Tax=Alkalicoccus saliphilus TaxID=200989 RepID=A0A2T4U1T4_9BACI|nr:hypothetical protein C6Y45_16975 [Alkalicoccus saliphilus]
MKTRGRLLFCLYREKWDEEMGRPEELEAEYFQLFTGRTFFDDLSQKKTFLRFVLIWKRRKPLSILPTFSGILSTFFRIVKLV